MSGLPKFFVYSLIDPRTDEVRYIGKTQMGMARLSQEHRDKISKAVRARRDSISDKLRLLWADPAWLERQRASRIGSSHSEETRQKMSVSQSERRRRERQNREKCNVAC